MPGDLDVYKGVHSSQICDHLPTQIESAFPEGVIS